MSTETLTLILAASTPVVFAIRWAYLKVKASGKQEARDSIESRFINDMATNHLPHIYHVQTLICKKMEVEVTEPPPIKFVDVNGNGKR
jgi:hypothetical protein